MQPHQNASDMLYCRTVLPQVKHFSTGNNSILYLNLEMYQFICFYWFVVNVKQGFYASDSPALFTVFVFNSLFSLAPVQLIYKASNSGPTRGSHNNVFEAFELYPQ